MIEAGFVDSLSKGVQLSLAAKLRRAPLRIATRAFIFKISVLIFIVGSFFCGFAGDMTTLIIFRAVQGIGGGGLAVTATTLIGEIIPLASVESTRAPLLCTTSSCTPSP